MSESKKYNNLKAMSEEFSKIALKYMGIPTERDFGKLKCGAKRSHLVLKLDDIEKVLIDKRKEQLADICRFIRDNRKIREKNPAPEYIVINTDEPYINDIIEILKKNGHWG